VAAVEEVVRMPVTPHERLTEALRDIIEKARNVSKVIESIRAITREAEEEEETERRA